MGKRRNMDTMTTVFTDNAKVMPKGQVTIPKDVRKALGVEAGDRVTFVVSQGEVRIINSAVYAMKLLQEGMQGQAEAAGIQREEDVMKLAKAVRAEE